MEKSRHTKQLSFFMAIILIISSLLVLSFSLDIHANNADETAQALYYGFNYTGGKSLMVNDALQPFAIIDPNSNYLSHVIKSVGNTEQTSENFRSSSIKEVATFLTSGFSTGAEVGMVGICDADLNATFNMSISATDSCSVYYDVYSTSITRYNYIVPLSISEIRQFLSPKFLNDVSTITNQKSAKAFLEKYGTHLNTGYSFGGKLIVTNYKSTSNSSIDFSESLSLGTKMSATINSIRIGASASIEEQYGSMENTSESKSTYKFKSYGGKGISSLTIDDLFTFNPSLIDAENSGFMYTAWINCINRNEDLAIIGVPNGAQTIPVWDLIEKTPNNSTIRQYLIDAYIEMCGGAYKEFSKSYPEFIKSINDNELEKARFTLNGLYVKTNNDYFYYVPEGDLYKDGDDKRHSEIHPGNYIYLDLTKTDYMDYSFETIGCSIVDAKKGIFEVNTKNENSYLDIYCIYGGNTESKYHLVHLDITPCNFEGGTGTKDYPYLIATKEQYPYISNNLSQHYLLLNDLDFEGEQLDTMNDFSGTLDGNYCKLSNFTLSNTTEWGMFKSISEGGIVKNLYLSNVGTSTNYSDFNVGETKCDDDNYTTNSVSANVAGIICSTNNGTIDNCFVNNAYIRNIVKNTRELMSNDTIELATGIIAGKNAGTISNCMVLDSNILNSFVYYNEQNKFNIYIYSGAIVGVLLDKGKISSCVSDAGSEGNVSSISDNYHTYNLFSGNKGRVTTYATYFVGYNENSNALIENCYTYIRGEKETLTAKIYNTKANGFKPNEYIALTAPVMILSIDKDDNGKTTFDNVYAYSTTNTDDVRVKKIKKNKDKEYTFEYMTKNETNVEKKQINSLISYNSIKLSSNIFEYDSDSPTGSHISHILSKIDSFTLQFSETMIQEYVKNDCFSPLGLKIEENLRNNKRLLNFFKLSFRNNNGEKLSFDTKLTTLGEGNYQIQASFHNKSIPPTKLKINQPQIIALYVANKEIDYESIDNFCNDFSYNSCPMNLILNDGTSIDLSKKSDYSDLGKIELITDLSSIGLGDNLIKVKFSYNKQLFESTFILSIIKKEIEKIEVAKPPIKTDYLIGEKVDLTGLELAIIYKDGSTRMFKSDDIDKIEIIGDVISAGDCEVTLVYPDYTTTTSFKVTGNVGITIDAETTNSESTTINTTQESSEIVHHETINTWWIVLTIIGIIGVITIVVIIIVKH